MGAPQVWEVDGKRYQCVWVNPATWPVDAVDTQETGESSFNVYVRDESVPKNEYLEYPPDGEPHVVATKAQAAVGNVLKSRARIEFIRLARAYPMGQAPGAIGMDGGGDPRANPNQRDKAVPTGGQRINSGLLAQPGAFPGDPVTGRTRADIEQGRRPVDDGPGLGTVLAGALVLDALTPNERHVSEQNDTLRRNGKMAEQEAQRNGTTFQEELDKPTKGGQEDDTGKSPVSTNAPTPDPTPCGTDGGQTFQTDVGGQDTGGGGGGFTSDVSVPAAGFDSN